MKIGFIGLGRMGQIIVKRLIANNVHVIVFNRTSDTTKEFIKNNKASAAYSLQELTSVLNNPRIIWMMVSHEAVDEVISQLAPLLSKNDIVIDAGNSFYKDSIRHFKTLKQKEVHFLDIGTSGGVDIEKNGACFMVGGEKEVFEKVKSILEILIKPQGGYGYFGPAGAGHFVKMVHNGIEYGMLQSLGEGFSILAGSRDYTIDLTKAAGVWSKGSIIRGYLTDLAKLAFSKDHRLSRIEGIVGGGSTGEWTVRAAKEIAIRVPVIETSLKERKKTHKKPTFAGKVIAALRYEFGGHQLVAKKK